MRCACGLLVLVLAGCSDAEATGASGSAGGASSASSNSSSASSTSSGGGAGGGSGGAPGGLPYECPTTLSPCPAFPEASWPTKTPAEVGLDDAALDAFVAATGNQDGVVVRYGYLVKTWGSADAEFGWASASKPVIATLLMFAVEEGKLASADALVGDWGWSLSPKDQSMTFRHLANMTSGYALGEAPGAAWAYNDYGIKLYALTIFERVFTDGSADAVAQHPSRLGPLAFEDGDIFADVNGAPRITTTPRDFARIGWMWANHGRWNGVELLPPAIFAGEMQPQVPASLPRTSGGNADDYLGIGTAGGGADQTGLGPGIYGFNWWFNPGKQTWPDAPEDTVQANGHWNGEVMTIVPSLGLVVAWRGNGTDPESFDGPMNAMLAELAKAVLD